MPFYFKFDNKCYVECGLNKIYLKGNFLICMNFLIVLSYRKASSRGAYGHYLFEVFLKSIDLIPQQQILQHHYLYYR